MSERRDIVELEPTDELEPPTEEGAPRWTAVVALLGVIVAGFVLANLVGGNAAEPDDTAAAISLPDDGTYEWTILGPRFENVVRVVDIVTAGDETIMVTETDDGTAVHMLAGDEWEPGPVFEDLIPDVVHASRSEVFIAGRRLLPGGERPMIFRGTGDSWTEDGVVGGGRVIWLSQENGVTVATLSRKAPPESQIAVQLPADNPLRQPLYTGDLRVLLPERIETPDGIQVAEIPPHRLVPLQLPRIPVSLEYDFERGWERTSFNDAITQREDTAVILPRQLELMRTNASLASAQPAIVATGDELMFLDESGFSSTGDRESVPYPGGSVPMHWDATSDQLAAVEPTRWPIQPTRRVVVDSLVELVSSEDGVEIEWNFLDTSGSADPTELNASIETTEEGTNIILQTPEANSPLYSGSLKHWNRLHTAITPAPAGVPRILNEEGRWSTLRPEPTNDSFTTMDLDLVPGGGVVLIEGTWKDRPERIMMGLPQEE
ncbi:MAG: hypothetical protein GEU79_02640 [Acidimicrobiia bacterium]|nr:hypothetical protein [Acidimicrobiia bacterium]